MAQRVANVAALLGSVRLFTQEEYEELCAFLGPGTCSEVRAAARRAVPHFSLPETGPSDVGALIEDLEDRASEPGVVPPVIQVIEEVAAARQVGGDGLQEWSHRVTTRLDQPGGDAPVPLVGHGVLLPKRCSRSCGWLWTADPAAEAFHYMIRLYDAHGRQVGTWTNRGHSAQPREPRADLSEAVGDLDQYEESAGVEFLLEEGFFGLAVDRLPVSAGPLGTRPIGLDRVVVLRGRKRRCGAASGIRAGSRDRVWRRHLACCTTCTRGTAT
ncbi:hypothetical protein [Streptomyces sp. KL116D]|uniref:hypothetical protein n=1 Tax=Streptomyces sp. KL116D TaxID=3045152 RepID=UPI003556A78A